MIDEKAKIAALEAELKFHNQSAETEKIRIQKDLAIAEARASVYREHLQDVDNEPDHYRSKANSVKEEDIKTMTEARAKFIADGKPFRYSRSLLDSMDVHNSVASKQRANKLSKINQLDTHLKENINPTITNTEERRTPEKGRHNNLNGISELCQIIKMQSAPDIDMDHFYGNPLYFQYFMSLGKLARLI